MKILLHSNYRPQNTGGIEKVVEQLMRCCLDDAEAQIEVIFGDDITNSVQVDRVTLTGLRILFKIKGMSVLAFGNLKFFMKGIKADHIIFQSPYPGLWLALAMLGILRKKITVYVHAVPRLPKYLAALYAPLERLTSKNSQLVFTSEAVRKDYFYGNENTNRGLVVPLYLDSVADNSTCVEFKLPAKYALYVGRLASYKGVEHILLSAKRLQDINFVIAGTGDLLPQVTRKVEELELSNVTLIGRYVSESEKSYLISNSNFVLFPSTTKNEAFGIVQLEAMYHKKPLINTRLETGVNFVAPDGVCALTVAPDSVMELSDAIETLWQNESLVEELGLNGHIRLKKEFSEEKFRRAWSEIIF